MILENGSSMRPFHPFKVGNWLRLCPIPLFLHDSLLFFKNRPRGFRYSIKDALAEIWKCFEVKSENRQEKTMVGFGAL